MHHQSTKHTVISMAQFWCVLVVVVVFVSSARAASPTDVSVTTIATEFRQSVSGAAKIDSTNADDQVVDIVKDALSSNGVPPSDFTDNFISTLSEWRGPNFLAWSQDSSLGEALEHIGRYANNTIVVVTAPVDSVVGDHGIERPKNEGDHPWIVVDGTCGIADAFRSAASTMNGFASTLQSFTGSPLHAITIRFEHFDVEKSKTMLAVDARTATFVVNKRLFDSLTTDDMQELSETFNKSSISFVDRLTALINSDDGLSIAAVQELITSVIDHFLVGNVVISGAVWCIACTMVLGISLPLLFNYGIAEFVTWACAHWHYNQQQCDSLMLEFLVVSFLFLFPGAYIIFKVCMTGNCSS
eukprot:TRINITY_DN16665_c0_g1_i2.p1 TRINITY_DN16665_c0_g1~~TRINITY_DN16665_c0_g1_i2.p1  ORF type:complete len:357 (+),score=60.61 TRINITY_DN16665_c0_g1_i2:131-1201(+)